MYDYRCDECGVHFERRQPVTAAQVPCPLCGTPAERVILYAPAVHGRMARGREAAVRSLAPREGGGSHGPGCPCCH